MFVLIYICSFLSFLTNLKKKFLTTLDAENLILIRRKLEVSFVSVVLRAESWFDAHLKFYHTSAGKSTFRTQNDTDKATFRYTANKKYLSYHVRNVF